MRNLEVRVHRLARAEQRRRLSRLAEKLRHEVPGVTVAEEADALVVRGRGLLRGWLKVPALRFVGSLWQ